VSSVSVGITLPPHLASLELVERAAFEIAEHWEVAPETLWRLGPDGTPVPNGFHELFLGWGERRDVPFVAHGVGFSVGTPGREPRRRAAWLARLREDAARFRFGWFTDHLGASRLGGMELTLPLPIPMSAASAAVVRRALDEMRTVVPDVGVENSVFYFHLGSPLDEPAFLAACLSAPRSHLLLDLHNVLTTAVNAGFEPRRYLEALPLERAIEIHVSGGRDSDPAWLRGEARRLDSHDDAVPEEVWRLLEEVLPRCPNLRAVTLERMERSLAPRDVPAFEDELRRARRIVELRRG
jgi:uncharacterized protein (UPF0276 family)